MIDTQIIELKARSLLFDALWADDIEVAIPVRDRGIDFIAYVDHGKKGDFVARPIQVKAASTASFGVDKKYQKFADLLIVYIWNVESPANVRFIVTDYKEACSVARRKGWLRTPTWEMKGKYSTSKPDKRLKDILSGFQVSAGGWRKRLLK